MSDHGAAIRSSIPDAKPSGPRGHVAHEPRRALIVPEPEIDGTGTESGPSPPQQRVKMRQRIARFGSSRPQTPALDPLFRIIRANHPKADLGLVERAYRKAEGLHEGQARKSGDAYITHPLAVTTILAELGMTEATLCAALLHDKDERLRLYREFERIWIGEQAAVVPLIYNDRLLWRRPWLEGLWVNAIARGTFAEAIVGKRG